MAIGYQASGGNACAAEPRRGQTDAIRCVARDVITGHCWMKSLLNEQSSASGSFWALSEAIENELPTWGGETGTLVKHEFYHTTGSHQKSRHWLVTVDRPLFGAVERVRDSGINQPLLPRQDTTEVCQILVVHHGSDTIDHEEVGPAKEYCGGRRPIQRSSLADAIGCHGG